MEAKFTGRLGQTVEISGNPEEIATAYAYLLAADIGSIKAMESHTPPKPKRGGYVEPPKMSNFEGRNPEDIFDALLDWVNDQIKNKNDDDDGDNEGE